MHPSSSSNSTSNIRQHKFISNERSIPKQTRPSYQNTSSDPSKQFKNPYYAQYSSKAKGQGFDLEQPKQSKTGLLTSGQSSTLMKTKPKQEYFKTLNNRRRNQGQMSNLKTELQNLKNEVNKLISKETNIRTPKKQKSLINDRNEARLQKSDKKITYGGSSSKEISGYGSQYDPQENYTSDREDDFSDTASMRSITSVTTEKVLNQPLRKLQQHYPTFKGEGFDQQYYMKLQNDLLKTQIKNLKNKYVSKKRQLNEKVQLLQKKAQYLEISLEKSQQSLMECRKSLQMEMVLIKKQLSQQQKTQQQQQIDKSQLYNYDPNQPQKDTNHQSSQLLASNNSTVKYLKDKVKELYSELNEKNNLINNLNIQIGDIESAVDHKKHQLKKQMQKNTELSKQIEFTKRQHSRLQNTLQTEISKKTVIQKENQSLKEKNKQMMNDLYTKDQIVQGSQHYQNRLSQEIQAHQIKENQYLQKIVALEEQSTRLETINQSQSQEIKYLKQSQANTSEKLTQLSKKLKSQQQKLLQRQDYYNQKIKQIQKSAQERIKILKQQYQSEQIKHSLHYQKSLSKTQENNSLQLNEILREKQQQINKWKAEYKILKLKHSQKDNTEKKKREQIDQYYKGYTKYKHQNLILLEKTQLYEEKIKNYIQKIKQMENSLINNQFEIQKTITQKQNKIKSLQRQILEKNEQIKIIKQQLNDIVSKVQSEIKFRHQLEEKIQNFIIRQIQQQQQLSFEEKQSDQTNNKDQNENEQPSKKSIQVSKSEKQEQSDFNQDDEQQQRISRTSPEIDSIKPLLQNKQIKHKIKTLTQSQKIQLQSISQSLVTLKKRSLQQDQKITKNIKQVKNKDAQIIKLRKQVRELLETHQKELLEIKEKYTFEKINLQFQSSLTYHKQAEKLYQQNILIEREKFQQILLSNTQMKRKIAELQKQLFGLRQQTQSLSHLYNVKCVDMQQMEQKFNFEREKALNAFNSLANQKNQKQIIHQNQCNIYKDQIQALRSDIKSNLSNQNDKIQLLLSDKKSQNFDQTLKKNIQSLKTLREQIQKKNDQIYKLRDNYTTIRSTYDNLRSQLQMQKLKSLSERKNLEVQYQIEQQNIKNQLSIQEKKVSSLQQKIVLVIQENKKKDSFIQSYIMGKKLPQNQKEFLSQFIRRYEIQLSGKMINQKLKGDSYELQKMAIYNYNLLRDLAQIKQKLLLYETMQNDSISLYQSRDDNYQCRDNDFDSPLKHSRQSLNKIKDQNLKNDNSDKDFSENNSDKMENSQASDNAIKAKHNKKFVKKMNSLIEGQMGHSFEFHRQSPFNSPKRKEHKNELQDDIQ